MAKKKTKAEEIIIETPVASSSGSVSVFDAMTKQKIRTYSTEEHGPEFRKLAMQFATKVKGVVL